jgi:hypothetical protein
MARRKRAAKAAADTGTLDRLLDQLDEGLANGDRSAVEAALPQIVEEQETAAGVLAQRLIDGRVRVPSFAFELLAGLSGPLAVDYFERVAEASEADDLVRFGAHRRLGWPERGEARQRLAFLDRLRDGEGTLVRVTEQAAATWPQNCETMQEVLDYLAAMPAKRRQALATRIAAEAGEATPWLWHALLHAGDKGTQRLAMRALTDAKSPGAAGPLGRLAQTTGDARLRAEATAAVQAVAADSAAPDDLPPVDQALLSMLDGDGGQVALVIRELGPGICLVVNVFHNERSGIKGAHGSAWLQRDEAEAMIEELEDNGVAMVGVPLAAVRGALGLALAINAARGQGLPPAYELWEPLLHDAYPPAPDEPITATILDDAPYAGRHDLVAETASLFAHPFFQTWSFEPDAIGVALANLALPGEMELTDEALLPLITALATPAVRAQLRDRLRRQAWLLDHLDDAPTRDLALAAAAALAADDQAALAALPFLRELTATSVEQVMAWGGMFM